MEYLLSMKIASWTMLLLMLLSMFILAVRVQPAMAFAEEQIAVSITLEKTYYNYGEPVNMTISISNISNETVTLRVGAWTFDFLVYNDTGYVYQWSRVGIFPMIVMDFDISPGENLSEVHTWPQIYQASAFSPRVQVPPGTYYVVAFPRGVERTAPIKINIGGSPGSSSTQALNLTNLKTAIGQGYDIPLNVFVENPSDSTEALNITLFNTAMTTISETVLNVSIGSSALKLYWDTSSLIIGSYAIQVSGENLTAEGSVAVTIPGDINGDFKVNLNDLIFLANAYGTNSTNTPGTGDHQWNPSADIDDDGVVGLIDLVILANHYNQQWNQSLDNFSIHIPEFGQWPPILNETVPFHWWNGSNP
jgi:hypothetical protein